MFILNVTALVLQTSIKFITPKILNYFNMKIGKFVEPPDVDGKDDDEEER